MSHPKTLGGCADRLFKDRAERLKLEAKVKALKAREVELADHIQGLLRKSRLDKASGKVATVAVTQKPVGTINDFTKLVAYAAEHEASDLIQRRVNGVALRDRTENGEKIPGVHLDFVSSLSVTKR